MSVLLHAVRRGPRRAGPLRGLAALGLALLLGWPEPSWSQTSAADEAKVKAGFVFNFIKFTQWPPVRNAQGVPLYLCTPGDAALPGALELLQGRPVAGRVIEVRRRVPVGEWRQCDVMFLSEGDAAAADGVLRQLGTAPVLTVGDLPGFVASGGMIGLRIESDRVRFDINLVAAQRAGLALNSQMLQLAGKVLR